MQFISTQKFVRMSPRKLRLVADEIKTLSPAEALNVLPLVNKRAAQPLLKVVKSAVANATQTGVTLEELKFTEIQISEGPRLKRGRPVSRGRWHPILKRMSHIRVVLESIPQPKSDKPKIEKKIEKPTEKFAAKKIKNKIKTRKGVKKS